MLVKWDMVCSMGWWFALVIGKAGCAKGGSVMEPPCALGSGGCWGEVSRVMVGVEGVAWEVVEGLLGEVAVWKNRARRE